jgi:hypothetical protein
MSQHEYEGLPKNMRTILLTQKVVCNRNIYHLSTSSGAKCNALVAFGLGADFV